MYIIKENCSKNVATSSYCQQFNDNEEGMIFKKYARGSKYVMMIKQCA
jgi:hypothetical protein